MKLAIYGGSFDPLHFGHLSVIESAFESLKLDLLLLLPNYQNPLKNKTLFSPCERLQMCEKIARFCQERHLSVESSSFEIDKNEKSYSIDSIRHFSNLYQCKPYLLLGSDSLDSLHLWRESKQILNLVYLVEIARVESKTRINLHKTININPQYSNCNATFIRECLLSGEYEKALSQMPQILHCIVKEKFKI